MKETPLLKQFKLNNTLTLKNRILMAPLTRCKATDSLIPTHEMSEYYARRSDTGLIITEATIISPIAQGYPNTPGIYNQEQIDAWKHVTKAVHKNGGKIFMQLWHVGRVSHSFYLQGQKPVAPSSVGLTGKIPRTDNLEYEVPRAMSESEIYKTILDYKQASKNAIEAGFDGVEIHGANGYLIDQFLHQESNKRKDQFGGSNSNRTKFALEVTKEIIQSIGSDKTAIRLSPASYFNMTHTDGDEKTFIYLLEQLSDLKLAYIHTGMFDDSMEFDYLGGNVTSFLRKYYQGNLVACGGYTPKSSLSAISEGRFDLVAIGRPLIANPDFVHRIESQKLLVEYDEEMLKTLY